jgi:hypothetical protein
MTAPVVDVGGTRIKMMVTARQGEWAVPSDALRAMELAHLRLACQS